MKKIEKVMRILQYMIIKYIEEICIRMTQMAYANMVSVYMTVSRTDGDKCQKVYIDELKFCCLQLMSWHI